MRFIDNIGEYVAKRSYSRNAILEPRTHPDLIDFTKVKSDTAKFKCNISVQCTDAFYDAVRNWRSAPQNASFKALWAQDKNVTFQILDAQQDNSRQISQIETAIRLKPDLLIVAPTSAGPSPRSWARPRRRGSR